MRRAQPFENWSRKLRITPDGHALQHIIRSVQSKNGWLKTWATWNCLNCLRRTPKRSAKHACHTGVKTSSVARADTSWKKWQIEVSMNAQWTFFQFQNTSFLENPWPQIWELLDNKKYYLSINLKKRCIEKDYKRIHDRFLRGSVFRGRMVENNRDDEICRACDVLTDEDHTYHMSEPEHFYYKNNWWISFHKSGTDTQPLRKRSDFNQALSTLKRSHQEAGRDQLEPIPCWNYKQRRPASSSSFTWWQWQESWLSS